MTGPVLGRALRAVAVVLVAEAVVAAVLWSGLRRTQAAQDRAVARTTGTVVEDRIGGEDDLRVTWTDAAGTSHRDVLGVYDVDRWPTGTRIPLRYDPARPQELPFVDVPDETIRTDDWAVPLGLSGVVTAGLLLGWAYRGLVFRLRSRSASRADRATVLVADLSAAPPIPLGQSVWVRLPDAAARGERGVQRVMWHPALEALGPGPHDVEVREPARGPFRTLRAMVVTLPDGTRLVPIGPRRRRVSRQWESAPWVSRQAADRRWVLPAGATPPPPRAWFRGTLALSVAAVVVGAGMGVVLERSSTVALLLAVTLLGLYLNGRALAGVRP